MKISVVIPVYGCRAALIELCNRLTSSVSKLSKDYEIILVNDACPQKSWEVIEQLCAQDEHIKGIELARNFGQMKAILAGLDYSTGDYIVVMDCDLQDKPEEIIQLYNKLQEGYDVVFARRKVRKDSVIKQLLANIFYKIYEFSVGDNYDGALCNFSIAKRKVVDSYCNMREQHRAYVMYIKWLGFKHAVVDVEHCERYEGVSSYDLKKRINLAFDILTSQSDKVLYLTVKFGAVISFIAFLINIALVVNYYLNNVTPGWTSIIATIWLVGGIIIGIIGIVGIYVGNIFMQVKNRPLYVIRNILNDNKYKK